MKGKYFLLSALFFIASIIIILFSYNKNLTALNEENSSLKEKVTVAEKQLQENKDLSTKTYEVRNVLDYRVHKLIRDIKESNIKELQQAGFSKNIYLEGSKLLNKDETNNNVSTLVYEDNKFIFSKSQKTSKDFIISSEYFRQRYFNLSENQATFVTGYEVVSNDIIHIMEFRFILENDQWILKSFDVDIG